MQHNRTQINVQRVWEVYRPPSSFSLYLDIAFKGHALNFQYSITQCTTSPLLMT